MENKIVYKKAQLKDALDDFSQCLSIDLDSLEPIIADAVKSGQVQKFEFTIELTWKVIKLFLDEVHGYDEKSPKSTIKRFYSLEYMNEEDYEAFMGCLDDRNRLSHTYNKAQFEAVYKRIIKSKDLFDRIYSKMS